MMHMVTYRSPEGQPVYHQTESLEDAARHLEHLRNSGQGTDARIFSMNEVRVEVKTLPLLPLVVAPRPTYHPVTAPASTGPTLLDTPTIIMLMKPTVKACR